PLVAKFFTAPNALLFNTVLPNSLPLVIVLETILLPFFSKSLPLERGPLRRFLPFDTKSFPLETVLETKLLPLESKSLPLASGPLRRLLPFDTKSLPLEIVLETKLLPLESMSLPLDSGPLRKFLPFDTKSFPLETVFENKLLPLDRRSFPFDFKKLAPLDIVFLSAVPPLENKFWVFPKKFFPLADKYIKLPLDFTASFPIDVIVTVLCFILDKVSLPLSRILNKVVCLSLKSVIALASLSLLDHFIPSSVASIPNKPKSEAAFPPSLILGSNIVMGISIIFLISLRFPSAVPVPSTLFTTPKISPAGSLTLFHKSFREPPSSSSLSVFSFSSLSAFSLSFSLLLLGSLGSSPVSSFSSSDSSTEVSGVSEMSGSSFGVFTNSWSVSFS